MKRKDSFQLSHFQPTKNRIVRSCALVLYLVWSFPLISIQFNWNIEVGQGRWTLNPRTRHGLEPRGNECLTCIPLYFRPDSKPWAAALPSTTTKSQRAVFHVDIAKIRIPWSASGPRTASGRKLSRWDHAIFWEGKGRPEILWYHNGERGWEWIKRSIKGKGQTSWFKKACQ